MVKYVYIVSYADRDMYESHNHTVVYGVYSTYELAEEALDELRAKIPAYQYSGITDIKLDDVFDSQV